MRKIIAIVLCVVLLLTMFVGCNDTSDKKLTKVRVNEVTHSLFYAPQYLAIELGYFKDEGLEIELTNGGGSNVSMTAVVSNQADIGLVGPETCVYVYNQQKSDYPIVFAQLTKRDGSFLIGREDKKFSFEDLKGKTIIAGRRGGLPAMTLEYLLNKNGLFDGENITLNYDIAFDMMAGAFKSGTSDYTTLFEPTASTFCKSTKSYNVMSVGKESGEVPYTCFVATKSFLEEKPEVVEGFLKAIYKAIKYMQTHTPSEIATVLKPQFEGSELIDVENSVKAYMEIDAYMTSMAMTEDSFIRLQDIMENAKVLDKRCEYTKLVDNTFAEKVYKEVFGE